MALKTVEASSRYTFWQSIREALRGSEQDYTRVSVSHAVLLLAIPMVLEMLMESLFAIVDVFWVTHLGSNAVATVGLTESVLMLVFSVAAGVGFSTTAMVARRIGEKDPEGAAVAAVQSILLGVTLSLAIGVPGAWFAGDILRLMGAQPDLVASGRYYTAIALGGDVVVLLLFLNNAIFRGAGDPAIAMRVLWGANLLNMVLGPLFIFGVGPFPRLGVTGAAVATLIGRGTGVAYQLWVLARGHSRVAIRREHLHVAWPVLGSLVRVSSTGVLQFVIAHSSWLALVRMISSFGASAVAGYTIGIRIFAFFLLPSWGLSGAAATLVGQNLGARRPDRAERAVWITGLYNMLFLAAVGAVFVATPAALVRLFTTDPAVLPAGVDCLRIVGYGNIGYALGMVMVQAFNGAGDTVTPTLINAVGFWLCEIPLAWMLAYHAGWGVDGVFASIPISECFITAMGLVCFWRGGWKRRRI